MSDQDVPEPPAAPMIDRGIRLYPFQWIGLPALFLLAVLALLGVFGESWGWARSESGSGMVDLDVRYTSRYRYKQTQTMTVVVRNRAGAKIDTLSVVFDPEYMSGFSTVRFLPQADRAYQVLLVDVAPSEERTVEVELQAERYGRHRGFVLATSGGADTARARVATLVYP